MEMRSIALVNSEPRGAFICSEISLLVTCLLWDYSGSRDHLPLHRDSAGGSRALPPVSSVGTRMTGFSVDGPVLTQVWKTSPGQRSQKQQE